MNNLGCGKSYTMMGVEHPMANKGIIPRAFEHIFEHVAIADERKYLIRATYLEIYNEEVRDLLGRDVKKRLDLHEHPDKGVYVQGLSMHKVNSYLYCAMCLYMYMYVSCVCLCCQQVQPRVSRVSVCLPC